MIKVTSSKIKVIFLKEKKKYLKGKLFKNMFILSLIERFNYHNHIKFYLLEMMKRETYITLVDKWIIFFCYKF
jgi:hypothetical protein